jgi:hypothetical protein
MSLSFRQRLGIAGVLALAMLATRINHFAPIPDASWAVFFAAGFYLRGRGRWAFPALMALAVAIDVVVIGWQGASIWDHYCMSAAYWFLVPAHAAMWIGGSTLRRAYFGLESRSAAWLLGTFLVAFSACFFISNVSFFWLSDGAFAKTLAGSAANFAIWYPRYLYTAALYVAGAAVLHVVVALIARELAPGKRALAD